MKTKNALCGLAIAVVLKLGMPTGSAQTYIYTYTGNDFTSVFNAAGEGFYGGVPYTTSSHITGSITFSTPLGDNYEGNPSATMLSYNFTDEVGPQSAAGSMAGGLGYPYVMESTFDTDSSGDIVSWNFAVTGFSPSGILTKGIQTENDSGNVVDSGNFVQEGVIEGEGSVSADPGVWVETVVPEPSAGVLFVSFVVLVLVVGRFWSSPPVPFPVHKCFSGCIEKQEERYELILTNSMPTAFGTDPRNGDILYAESRRDRVELAGTAGLWL